MPKMLALLCLMACTPTLECDDVAHAPQVLTADIDWETVPAYLDRMALEAEWQDTLHEWGMEAGPDIIVRWSDMSHEYLAVSSARLRTIDLSTGYQWSVGICSVTAPAYDVESVLLHEIGHVQGLEHADEPGRVMSKELGPCQLRRYCHAPG